MPANTARHSDGTIRRRGSRWQVDTTVAGPPPKTPDSVHGNSARPVLVDLSIDSVTHEIHPKLLKVFAQAHHADQGSGKSTGGSGGSRRGPAVPMECCFCPKATETVTQAAARS